MSEPARNADQWTEANRLLGGLASSVGSGVKASLGASIAPDDWSERAAILEFDGGLPREAAERFAREIAALGPNPSLASIAALDGRLRSIELRARSKGGGR
jgi:hypothetical protein